MTARKYNHTQHFPKTKTGPYEHWDQIDGWHPIQDRAPGTYVSYSVRQRKNGKVCYFNFDLAKEMGLIAEDHSYRLNHQLSQKILETFSLIIINEYDYIHRRSYPEEDIKPRQYMATRYLQLQHRSKIGLTSGDGRGIWNGTIRHKGKTWDITSCGTGATCLSPASANNQIFYKSGDPSVSYGCGFAELMEAVGNSVFSEIMHRNGVPTERTLCIIEYPGNFCVIVRAGSNLIRPSHFFNHLKQGQYRRLKDMFDLFLERQAQNGDFKSFFLPLKQRYDAALEYMATSYARSCALFESEYIFCWMDWDGDNMLADGGIIDYGSIRQMGLCHHDYRFDDDERWSTNLKEQRIKGRYIVQTLAQMVDYLKTGVKKNRNSFAHHRSLKKFDQEFELERYRLFLRKLGLDNKQASYVLEKKPKVLVHLFAVYTALERWMSDEGVVPVADGVSRNAIYNMRMALRLLCRNWQNDQKMMNPEDFLSEIIASHATVSDCEVTRGKLSKARDIQRYYGRFMEWLDKNLTKHATVEIASRCWERNRTERVTGDAMHYVGKAFFQNRNRIPQDKWHELLRVFIDTQSIGESAKVNNLETAKLRLRDDKTKRLLAKVLEIVAEFKEGL